MQSGSCVRLSCPARSHAISVLVEEITPEDGSPGLPTMDAFSHEELPWAGRLRNLRGEDCRHPVRVLVITFPFAWCYAENPTHVIFCTAEVKYSKRRSAAL